MIRRIALLTLWLLAGGAMIAGLFWAFLNTPESNLVMLIASALLVVIMIGLAGVVTNVAVLLGSGETLRASVARAPRPLVWFIAAAVPTAFLTWMILRGDAWVAQKSGEISAWFIARFGWSDISMLFRAEDYLSTWLRWVLLPVTALAALAARLAGGSLAPRTWLRGAWHWRTLLVATLAFVLLIRLPWRAAFWDQNNLPSTWVQPVLAGVRLGVVSLLICLGAAVIVVAATRASSRKASHVAE